MYPIHVIMWFYAFSLMVNFCLVTVSVNGQNAEKKPLILVRKEGGQESFVFPTYASYDITTKTFTYQSAPSETVRYFCPAETEEQKTTIQGSDDLQYCLFGSDTPTDLCNQELKPFIRKAFDENEERSEIECSIGDDKGLLYNFGYQLCQSQAPEEVESIKSIKTNFITIYNFCHRSMQTLYIQYEIFSPNLLKNEVLLDANNLWFQDNSTNGYGLFDENQDFMWKQAHMQILHLNFEEKSDTQPVFKGALASPSDIVFAAWKIPFFHYANVVLIYNQFYNIWKFIEFYISKAATRLLGQITIYSGIYPSVPTIVTDPKIQPSKEVQKEIPSILWRLIYNKEKNAAVCASFVHVNNQKRGGRGNIPVSGWMFKLPIGLYLASKFAVKVISDGLRREMIVEKVNVEVSNISLGLVDTDMTAGHIPEDPNEHISAQDIANACMSILNTPPNVVISELTILPIAELV